MTTQSNNTDNTATEDEVAEAQTDLLVQSRDLLRSQTTGDVKMTLNLQYGESWYETGRFEVPATLEKWLWANAPTKKTHMFIYGKSVEIPRLHKNFGEPYEFSGIGDIEREPEIPSPLQRFVVLANEEEEKKGREGNFNQVLVNWYRDGASYIGYHSDDERGLSGPVYTFSVGGARRFKLQSKDRRVKDDHTLSVSSGDFLSMCGQTQKYYKHSVPKQVRADPRVSITIRRVHRERRRPPTGAKAP